MSRPDPAFVNGTEASSARGNRVVDGDRAEQQNGNGGGGFCSVLVFSGGGIGELGITVSGEVLRHWGSSEVGLLQLLADRPGNLALEKGGVKAVECELRRVLGNLPGNREVCGWLK
ncbi:hypothetical protein AXG93_1200s1450 [Marchantia polymorpha subsp. ruderalis]|uniref:Uncharacterized protein n=1 Tax=Marchantia polymorpha subsp. ruderalis TaxID=1480154 RepID=A0A176WKX1_MARPO|nr:hypothetical protein AXG93_1200s1450 [Marchantia polymorpha subsp. ruderalis]